jgi:hypothetical protein
MFNPHTIVGIRSGQADFCWWQTRAVIQRFVDDEDGYLNWLSIRATGYVLNCERDPPCDVPRSSQGDLRND